MAAEEEWYFEEEGCLQFSGRPTSITFSPTSNCFICTLEDGSIEVVDVRSGLRLKRTTPAGQRNVFVQNFMLTINFRDFSSSRRNKSLNYNYPDLHLKEDTIAKFADCFCLEL